jgi:hypothetical protein
MTGAFDPRPIVRRFWERAGATEAFPRRLTPTIAAVLPVAVVLLPRLTVAATAEWLARRGAGCIGSSPDRSLRGCLIAQRGHGFIFIDGSLADDEQRLTLAHETAHFLHHYEAPRTKALELLGSAIQPALDGDREATPQERLRGALRGVPIGVYEHLLDRADGAPDPTTARLEAEADLIGFELLAPTITVLRGSERGADCRAVLEARFGLPSWAAARWGAWVDSRRRGDPFLRRLQAAREKNDR